MDQRAIRREQPRQFVKTDPKWGVEFAVSAAFPAIDATGRRVISGASGITTAESIYGVGVTGATAYGSTASLPVPGTNRSCLSIFQYSGTNTGTLLSHSD